MWLFFESMYTLPKPIVALSDMTPSIRRLLQRFSKLGFQDSFLWEQMLNDERSNDILRGFAKERQKTHVKALV